MTMKRPLKESSIGRFISVILSVASTSSPLTRLVKKVILGGTIDSLPVVSSFKNFLDINQDGKVDIKDLRALRWEDIAKVVVVLGIWYALYHFKLLSELGF